MYKSSAQILKKDPALKNELEEIIDSGRNIPIALRNKASHETIKKAMVGSTPELPRAEAMIHLHLRPALLIKNNKIETPDSVELRNRMRPFLKKIEHTIPSVGRIEFVGSNLRYGGTGWMISEDTIVTNRHVAELVAEKRGKSIVFRKNFMGIAMEALIDFKEEYIDANVATPEFEVELEKVLYMTANRTNLPDIAFLRIKKNAKLPAPLFVSDKELKEKQFISVIGYPAYDVEGVISDIAAGNVFNGIYEVKRCSPGEVLESVKSANYFTHDCTTLGGNSGSVVIDNETGEAVGLHWAGTVKTANYAVKGKEVIKEFRKINPTFAFKANKGNNKPKPEFPDVQTEAPPESYSDRKGFNTKFLGNDNLVSLPRVSKNKSEVLSFTYQGKKMTELKYQHFSVVMNKERRQCFFSACNIDGKESKRGIKRAPWRTDSRIPSKYQIIKECYGNPPKFSRGHMTRREDPNWGPLATARIANEDTFHVTNAVPQMQAFNAPIWLALEDYALQNARQDDMRISVITGPIFTDDDPTKYGVRIPINFFKIIAFIHDDTGELCATGYTVSQMGYVPGAEFVFGEFETYQVSIKSIQTRTGLSFGKLSEVDQYIGEESVKAPLISLDEVRFY
jgi:endonuclease G